MVVGWGSYKLRKRLVGTGTQKHGVQGKAEVGREMGEEG